VAPAVCAGEVWPEVVTVEEVVSQNQRAGPACNEVLANEEGLGEAIRRGLHRVLNGEAPLRAIAEELLKAWRVLGSGDQQEFPNAREHQGGERVEDHGFVVDRQQLFAHGQRGGVQARARAARQDDAHAGRLGPNHWVTPVAAARDSLVPLAV